MAQQQFNTYKGKHNIADIDTALDRVAGLDTEFAAKQATLVSGTNIKTVNNQSILGSGNIEIETTVPTASAVGITTIDGLTATNVQTALAQIYAKAKESGLSDAQIAAAIATYLASHPIEGVAEAPKDGKQYARKDGVWSEVQATSGDSTKHHLLTSTQMAALTAATAVEGEIYIELEGYTGTTTWKLGDALPIILS